MKATATGRLKRIKMEDIAEMLDPILDSIMERWITKYQKPVISTTFTERSERVSEMGHFPYPSAEQAALVLSKLVEYKEYLDRS